MQRCLPLKIHMIYLGTANDQLSAAVIVASLHIHDESILPILVDI